MPRQKFSVGASAATKEMGEGTYYTGDVPPGNTAYALIMKRLTLKKNKNKDWMLNFVLEIDEPEESEKSEYNGFGFWCNLNVNEQGAGYANNFLDAFGFNRKEFWGPGPVTEGDAAQPDIVKIGSKRVDPDGMSCVAFVKSKPKRGDYDASLDLVKFVLDGAPKAEGGSADDGFDDEKPAASEPAGAAQDEPYTEDELAGMDAAEVEGIAKDEFELDLAQFKGRAAAKKKAVIAAILEEQEKEATPEAEASGAADGEPLPYTREELEAMPNDELVAEAEASFPDDIKLADFQTTRRGRKTLNKAALIDKMLELDAGEGTNDPPF